MHSKASESKPFAQRPRSGQDSAWPQNTFVHAAAKKNIQFRAMHTAGQFWDEKSAKTLSIGNTLVPVQHGAGHHATSLFGTFCAHILAWYWLISERANCGAKPTSKSKLTKDTWFRPFLQVVMSKKCTPLWREAHFEVTWPNNDNLPHRGKRNYNKQLSATLHYRTHFTRLPWKTVDEK